MLWKFIEVTVQNKNPAFRNNGRTLLHLAAGNGRSDVYKVIMKEVEDKNPTDVNGGTPLHEAAYGGHLDVCRLIVDNIDNKHPVDTYGKTPKCIADEQNHTELSKLFK